MLRLMSVAHDMTGVCSTRSVRFMGLAFGRRVDGPEAAKESMCLEKFQSPLVMQWTAPATGIAMCQIPADVEGGPESGSVNGCRTPAAARGSTFGGFAVALAGFSDRTGALGDFEPSGAVTGTVAGGGGRPASRISAG